MFVTATALKAQPPQDELGVSVQPSLGRPYPPKEQTTVGIVPAVNCFGKVICAAVSSVAVGALTIVTPHCIFTGLSVVVLFRFTFIFSASGIVVKSIL
nr:MAG TPA: hypothetical protein [Caudoviricetes sp.]